MRSACEKTDSIAPPGPALPDPKAALFLVVNRLIVARILRHQCRRIERRHQRIDLGEARGLLGDEDSVRPRLNLGVADGPGHQPRSAVNEFTAGELALDGLDGGHQLPALRNADDDSRFDAGIDPSVAELIEHRANPRRVDADGALVRKLPGLAYLFDEI